MLPMIWDSFSFQHLMQIKEILIYLYLLVFVTLKIVDMLNQIGILIKCKLLNTLTLL